MHLLQTSATTLDDIVEPVDLGQTPGDIVVLSFADSDLAGLATAYGQERGALTSVRLAHLRDLRHPMSIDLWIDSVAQHAKVILVRLLGGLDWWRYGVESLSEMARARGIALAVLPGEDRDDPRLFEASTLAPEDLRNLLAYFREGGITNLQGLLRCLAAHAGARLDVPAPQSVPRMAGYMPGQGALPLDTVQAALTPDAPVVPILFYRAAVLAADTGPIDGLCAALAARGLAPAPLFVPSLKDKEAGEFVRNAFAALSPAVVVATTAFAAGDGVFEGLEAPVLQAVIATTRRDAWVENPRGLGPADLAMHVVLPELDGRVLTGALGFKDALPKDDALGFVAFASRPEPDRIDAVADKIAAFVKLQRTPREERRIAVVLPDYPAAGGRTGYAVGLDVPASVLALLDDLRDAGYMVDHEPADSRRCSTASSPALTSSFSHAQTMRPCLASFPARSPMRSRRPGACRTAIPISATAPSAFVRRNSAMSSWRCRRTVAALMTVAPIITIQPCRRAMRCSLSAFGSSMRSAHTPCCISARTARWNGCRATQWR